MNASTKHWSDKYRTPENICTRPGCGHPRDSHIDASDRGWCTLPVGSCVASTGARCACPGFVEPAVS